MVTRWTFTDPATATTVTLPMNPSEGGTPERSRNVGYEATTAPDGVPVIFDQQRPPAPYACSGTILTQAHYLLLDDWATRSGQIVITDDLGRVFTIVVTKFTPKRVRSSLNPWKHTFELAGTILAEA